MRKRRLSLVCLAIAVAALAFPSALAARAWWGRPGGPVLPAGHQYLGLNDQMLYGTDGIPPEQKADLVRTFGGDALRTSLDWGTVEPQRGQWDEPALIHVTNLYEWSLARGIRPIFDLINAPSWAGVQCPGDCVSPPRESMNWAWASYVAEMARRYPQAMFEIWNEPNLKSYWGVPGGPDPQRFAELNAIAYRAIKAVDPAIPVLMGGLARNTDSIPGRKIALGRFLRRVYRARPSIEGHMDALAFHIYPRGTDLGPGSNFAKAFSTVRKVRARFNDARTPLFVTELGLSTGPPDSVTQAQQSATLLRAYKKMGRMPDVRGLIFHRLVEPKQTSTSEWEWGMGFLRYGLEPPRPRPVYCRFVALSGQHYAPCLTVL